jgi:eukaryotic-like serine/threonine-protein kinase
MGVIPEKIGKYEIVQEVGHGSMGTVYSAHDPFSDRLVAIKVAHPQFVDQSEAGQRFRKLFFNEAHAAGSLDHPNILRILDADVDGDLCYLVMEYVDGAQTLEQYVKPDRLLTLREVVGIIYKCAKALDHAHRQGVIHRDIKPSNLLLNEERDVKVADFSIAMITRPDNKHTQFTGFLGSPLYMSPEQINELPLSSPTDIFSLGTVMYQMLTGNHPFKADNLNAINQRITREEPPPLSSFRNDLPDGLSYTLRRMLRKNPAQRYQTGLDLAADLAVIFEDLDAVPNEDALREKFGTIKNLGFFKGFSDADIWELIRACTWQNYPAGTPVIKDGESDHSFYIVLSGVVGIEKNGRAVDSLQEGACFGEMGYLSRARRTASVVAKTDVSLMKVNASTIDRAAESTQLRFHKVFVRTLIARLADTTNLLAETDPV